MIIQIIDPSIDGRLNIINPQGKNCGVINFNMEVNYPSYNELPTLDMSMTTYLTILGRDYLPHNVDSILTKEEKLEVINLLAERIKELSNQND